MSGTIHTAEDADEALAQLSELTLKDAEVTPPWRRYSSPIAFLWLVSLMLIRTSLSLYWNLSWKRTGLASGRTLVSFISVLPLSQQYVLKPYHYLMLFFFC
jgi:hypothetical protein